jgi:protein-disulfide isomerase
MIKAQWLALGAAALALAGCDKAADNTTAPANGSTTAAGPVAPPQGGDWTQVVSQTPEGGFRMGNPEAPVKLVEYLSLTCPHCAEFSETGMPGIQTYVKKGTVSLEIRNYVRDPLDVTATLIARCQGGPAYFSMTEQALAQQTALLTKAQSLPPAELQRVGGLPPSEQFKAFAQLLGLDQFAKQRGIPEAKLNACLADKAALDQLVAMQKYANETVQIPGTPAFLLNGTMLQNAGTWQQLEPQLKQAGA